MAESIKAALLSGFVFPGLGQLLFLKRIARGCLFLLPSAAAALYLFYAITSNAEALAQQAGSTHAVSIQMLAASIAKSGTGSPLATMAALILPLAWIGSILDALIFGNDPHLSRPRS